MNISEFVDSSHTMSEGKEKTILENDDGARRDVILSFAAKVTTRSQLQWARK